MALLPWLITLSICIVIIGSKFAMGFRLQQEDIIVAIMDTGIYVKSRSFGDHNMSAPPKTWKGVCEGGKTFECNNKIIGARFYGKATSAWDEESHGTHVASLAIGRPVLVKDRWNGYTTMVGQAPHARGAIYRVCTKDKCPQKEIYNAIMDAITDRANIISISLGAKGFPFTDIKKDLVAKGSLEALKHGILTVQSAGNAGDKPFTIFDVEPVSILTVGSMDTSFPGAIRVAKTSSRGPTRFYPDLTKPDVLAPGVDMLGAVPPFISSDGVYRYSGTSVAAPYVSGVAAQVLAANPHFSPTALKSAILTTATEVSDDPFATGFGLVNPEKAVDPGLVFDASPDDYFSVKNGTMAMRDLNQPSVTLMFEGETQISVTRMATNVGPANSYYTYTVQEHPWVRVLIQPKSLNFTMTGERLEFTVKVKIRVKADRNMTMASVLKWKDGDHEVRMLVVAHTWAAPYYSFFWNLAWKIVEVYKMLGGVGLIIISLQLMISVCLILMSVRYVRQRCCRRVRNNIN